jgi:hypothetical protein
MTSLSLKTRVDAPKLTGMLAKNIKIVDIPVGRRQAINQVASTSHLTKYNLKQLELKKQKRPMPGGGGFNSTSNSMVRPIWGFTHPWPKVDRGESYEL